MGNRKVLGEGGGSERAKHKKKSTEKSQKSIKSEKSEYFFRFIFTGNGVFSLGTTSEKLENKKKSTPKILNDDFARDILIKNGVLTSNVICQRCRLS